MKQSKNFNSNGVAEEIASQVINSIDLWIDSEWGSGDWILIVDNEEYSVDDGSIVGGPKSVGGEIIVPVSKSVDYDTDLEQDFKIKFIIKVTPIGRPISSNS